MKTVKYKTNDARLTLFANTFTYLVGTDEQHINAESSFKFAGNTIKAGDIFTSLGQNILHQGQRFLQAKEGHFYQVKGAIKDVMLPGKAQAATLMVFTSFSSSGNDTMAEFAKAHDEEQVFFALAYDEQQQTLQFVDSKGDPQQYIKSIELIDGDEPHVLADEVH